MAIKHNTAQQSEKVCGQFGPYRRSRFKSACDGRGRLVNNTGLDSDGEQCVECGGSLQRNDFETYCSICGLVHREGTYWEMSLSIEAQRRQFNHKSTNGNGTLQIEHSVVIEDSVAQTTFDGEQLDANAYPLSAYNNGTDGHRGRSNDIQKLDRTRRFVQQRAEACASTVGLNNHQIQMVVRLVTSHHSGPYTSYGPKREGGGQDAHIIAAIVRIGNEALPNDPNLVDISDRMEKRDAVQSLAEDLQMNNADIHNAVKQLHKQLNNEL